MVYGFYPKQKAYINSEKDGHVLKTSERDYQQEQIWHEQMLNSGFQYDSTHDFYYSQDGALMSESQESIESLLTYPRYASCQELGYEMVYGVPTPNGVSRGETRAIYCKNFEEIVRKHETAEEVQNGMMAEEDTSSNVDEGSKSFRK